MLSYYADFEIDPKDGGFVVRFPDFGYGVTQGDNVEEATAMAEDLLRNLVQEAIRRSAPLPRASKLRRRRNSQLRLISLAALDSAKAELYAAFLASGLTKAEFARRVRIAKTNVDRLFDVDHASRLDQIEAAFRALGKRLSVVVDNAA
jgi:antitoxin HicB